MKSHVILQRDRICIYIYYGEREGQREREREREMLEKSQ
jgi:hypothetical protein